MAVELIEPEAKLFENLLVECKIFLCAQISANIELLHIPIF